MPLSTSSSSMKRGIKRTLIGLSITTFLLALPLAGGIVLFSNSNIYEDTFLGGMKLKRDLLKSTPGKRIVLIGGSSLPFGIQSHLIEQELPDYKVVNFGLYGALGSEAMFDLASPYIHEQDIVIISIEQSEQTLSSYFSPRTMWRAIDNCKEAFFDLDPNDQKMMFGDAFSFSSEKLPYIRSSTKAEGDGVYAYSSFNKFGDIMSELTPNNIMYEGVDSNQMISFSTDVIQDSFIQEMNDFAAKVKQIHGHTYYWFAPANNSAVHQKNRLIDLFYEHLNQRLNFPILGDPHDAVMNARYFFDTNFHLNSAGSQNNTRRLVMDLKAALKDDSKTSIEQLPPPPLGTGTQSEGNNADIEYFRIVEGEQYCEIVGLTAEGAAMEELTVPYSYHDKIIATFDAGTFAGNQSLKKITIQNNIRRIENRSFANSSIRRIILQNESPSSVPVGHLLLEDSQANIYVPWYSLSKYRSNYYWSAFADRIFAFR